MSTECNYHNRVDFRAFDVMVNAINNADRSEIEAAIKTCNEVAYQSSTSSAKRVLWRDFGRLLRSQQRRF